MLTKNDFATADWNTLRDTPYLVGLATLMAEPSGLGTIKEAIGISIWESMKTSRATLRSFAT
jgi:hypothetical protein